jgi:peptidoglycan/xylan/chitin deacetylase (PgdA/CDA1 family)
MTAKKAWYPALIILIALMSESLCRAEVIVSLRCDDYSAISNFEVEKRIIEILNTYQLPHTFGVIPNASINTQDISNTRFVPLETSAIRVETLRDAIDGGLLEVGLHGYTHQTCNSTVFSEFYGLPYEIQREKIFQAKSYLENLIGTPISAFIPPYNTYDENTVAACLSEGIEILAASSEPPYTYVHAEMIFLPSMIGLEDMVHTVQYAANLESSEPLFIMVLYHSYDFTESGSDRSFASLSEFEAMIEQCSNVPNVRFMNLRQIAQAFPAELQDRYAQLVHYERNWWLLNGIPTVGAWIGNRILGKYDRGVYWTEPVYSDLSRRLFRTLVIVYVFVAIMAALLSILYCRLVQAMNISPASLIVPIVLCSAIVILIVARNYSGIARGFSLGILDRLALIFFLTSDIVLLAWIHRKRTILAARTHART